LRTEEDVGLIVTDDEAVKASTPAHDNNANKPTTLSLNMVSLSYFFSATVQSQNLDCAKMPLPATWSLSSFPFVGLVWSVRQRYCIFLLARAVRENRKGGEVDRIFGSLLHSERF